MTKIWRNTLFKGLALLLVLVLLLGFNPTAQALDSLDVNPYIEDIMGLSGFGQPAQENLDLWHAATVLQYDPDYAVAWTTFHAEADKLLTEGSGETQVLNLEKLIIIASAAGYDVRDFPAASGQVDILALLESKLAEATSLDTYGTNTLVFALLALDAGQSSGSGYADQTTLNRADLLTAILDQQIDADGGWNWFPTDSSDIDLTAMTVTALAPYAGNADVAGALEDALAWLHSKQNAGGAFPGWGGEGESCTSSAAVVLAALAMGEDPAGTAWTKDSVSLLEAVLACHRGDVLGGFAESAGSNLYNEYTTEQVLRALVAYAAAGPASPYYFYQFDLPATPHTSQRTNSYDAYDGREPQKGQLSGTSNVWVRVESYDGSVQTKTQVTVDNPASAEDALKAAVGADNVEYAFGMLSKIKGVEAPANASWMAYKNNLAMNASAAQTAVEDGDSIVFSILDWMVGGYAYFNQEAESVKINTALTLSLQNVTFPSTTAVATAGATLSISPATGWQISGPTDANGQAQITFTETGTYTVTASRANAGATGTGVDITRPYCLVTVSTTGGSGSGGGGSADTGIKVTLSVHKAEGQGSILSSRTVTLDKGATVYDALEQALASAGKSAPGITGRGANIYVKEIEGLAENTSSGSTLGWKYRVDGTLPSIPCSAYILEGGEKIQWFYGGSQDEGDWLDGLDKTTEEQTGTTDNSSTAAAKPAQLLDGSGQPVSGYTPVTIPVTEADGAVHASLDEALVTELLAKTLTAGFKAETALVWLEAPAVAAGQTAPHISQYSLTVQPAQWLALQGKELKVITPFGTATLDATTIAALAKREEATELRLSSGLAVGLYSGGSALALPDLGGSLALEIPYTLGAEENAQYVVAVQKSAGAETILPRSRYANGYVRFSVTATGSYEARYNALSFTDTAGEWMDEVVRYMAARGVISGVGEERFAPQRNVTRGEFITMLMRTLALTAEDAAATEAFADAQEGAFYYEALHNAKALGLVNGVGENRFAPEAQISRQDMFVMLYNAMRAANLITPASSGMDLLKFDDYAAIATYAENALLTFVQQGLVQGSENKLNPGSAATRAEAAQVLYNMLTGF